MSLEYSLIVKLLTEHHFEFLSLKEAAQARLSLHLSKCHIFGNHVSRLKCTNSLYSPEICCMRCLVQVLPAPGKLISPVIGSGFSDS